MWKGTKGNLQISFNKQTKIWFSLSTSEVDIFISILKRPRLFLNALFMYNFYYESKNNLQFFRNVIQLIWKIYIYIKAKLVKKKKIVNGFLWLKILLAENPPKIKREQPCCKNPLFPHHPLKTNLVSNFPP